MKVLIADDHDLVRDGLKITLEELGKTPEIVEAANADEVNNVLRSAEDFDLAIFDLFMPGSDGFGLLSRLCNTMPNTAVIVLSATDNPDHVQKAIDSGASGFVHKSESCKQLLNAVRLVLSGGIYLPPDSIESAGTHFGHTDQWPDEALSSNFKALTDRQKEVLQLLGEGQQNKQIAHSLGVSENTVKVHIAAIFKVLKVANRTQAAMMARSVPWKSFHRPGEQPAQ